MTIPDIIAVLRDEALVTETPRLQAIARALEKAERETKEQRKAEPRGKTRLVILVRGDAALQRALDGGGWVVSVPDDDTTNTYSAEGLVNRLRKAVIAHNEAPKGRRKAKTKVETWAQCFTQLRAKTLKDSGSQIGIKQKGNPAELVVLTSETVQPSNP